jgi:hypothetical protein
VRGGGESTHVGADLGDEGLRGTLVDAGDRVEERNLTFERGDRPLDFLGQLGDRRVEEVDLGENRPHQARVVRTKATDEGLFEVRNLLSHRPASELGKDLGVALARDERGEHRSRRLAL